MILCPPTNGGGRKIEKKVNRNGILVKETENQAFVLFAHFPH